MISPCYKSSSAKKIEKIRGYNCSFITEKSSFIECVAATGIMN